MVCPSRHRGERPRWAGLGTRLTVAALKSVKKFVRTYLLQGEPHGWCPRLRGHQGWRVEPGRTELGLPCRDSPWLRSRRCSPSTAVEPARARAAGPAESTPSRAVPSSEGDWLSRPEPESRVPRGCSDRFSLPIAILRPILTIQGAPRALKRRSAARGQEADASETTQGLRFSLITQSLLSSGTSAKAG